MPYDPFQRGDHPVGVRTLSWSGASRGRTLPVELYYPATSDYRGKDLDPATQDYFTLPAAMAGEGVKRSQSAVRGAKAATGMFPILIFAHGYSGDRRETTFICTHLASHGYRVVSADHVGSTFEDVQRFLAQPNADRSAHLPGMVADRMTDIPFLLDHAEREFGLKIEEAGVTGASLGGFTSLIAPQVDRRVTAIVPLCPAGGDTYMKYNGRSVTRDMISFDWKQHVAVLIQAGDRDSWLTLYGILELLSRCPAADRQLIVLKRADHQHFVDDMEACHEWFRKFTVELARVDAKNGPPWSAIAQLIEPWKNLMPEIQAQRIVNGFATAHFDAALKKMDAASYILNEGFTAAQRRHDLDVYKIRIQPWTTP